VTRLDTEARRSLVISEKQQPKVGAAELSTIETNRILASTDDEYQEPTEEELKSLRKVAGSIPWISYALCVVEFAERASYYGQRTASND
jgi:hypothetical protein